MPMNSSKVFSPSQMGGEFVSDSRPCDKVLDHEHGSSLGIFVFQFCLHSIPGRRVQPGWPTTRHRIIFSENEHCWSLMRINHQSRPNRTKVFQVCFVYLFSVQQNLRLDQTHPCISSKSASLSLPLSLSLSCSLSPPSLSPLFFSHSQIVSVFRPMFFNMSQPGPTSSLYSST